MNRRDFLKTALANSAFLPTFAQLAPPVPVHGAAEKAVNVALIGFGAYARVLCRHLLHSPGVRVRAVCDIWRFHQQQASAFFKSYGQPIEAFEAYGELLEKLKGQLDAVVVATPDCFHREHVCACLQAGLHVFCAAPLAHRLEDAATMCRVAKATGRLLQVSFDRRSAPRYRLGIETILPNLLGRLVTIEAQFNRRAVSFFRVKRPPKPEILTKYGYGDALRYQNWRWFKSFAQAPVAEWAVQQIDLFRWVCGGNPVSVTAVWGHDLFQPPREGFDRLMCCFTYRLADGREVQATYRALTCNAVDGQREVLIGAYGQLRLSPLDFNVYSRQCKTANVFRRLNCWSDDNAIPAPKMSVAACIKKGWIRPSPMDVENLAQGRGIYDDVANSEMPWTTDDTDNPLGTRLEDNGEFSVPSARVHLDNFFAAIRKKEPLNCPGETAYAAMVAFTGALRAAETGRPVTFKPEDFEVPAGGQQVAAPKRS